MNKKLSVALFTIFCTILIMVSIYSIIPSVQPPQTRTVVQNTFVVRDYGGKVAAFRCGEDEPFRVYDIYTHLLPENDIELLRRGITVDSEEQLMACLEDLGL